jgi:hypothetical protein
VTPVTFIGDMQHCGLDTKEIALVARKLFQAIELGLAGSTMHIAHILKVHMFEGMSWKRLVSLLAVLLLVSVHAGGLNCVRPGCASPDSHSMMKCGGMDAGNSGAALESADRPPCCQMHPAPANSLLRTAIQKAPSVSPVRGLPQVTSVSLILLEARPFHRAEASLPKLRFLLCSLLI